MTIAFMTSAFNMSGLLTLLWPALLSAVLWALVVWTLRQDRPPPSLATRVVELAAIPHKPANKVSSHQKAKAP